MDSDTRISIMKTNIDTVMRTFEFRSMNAMARAIGVSPTTLNSYYHNLLSNSTAKTALCNFLGITVQDFEDRLLTDEELVNMSEADDNDDYINIDEEKPITEMTEEEIDEFFADQCAGDFQDERLIELKNQVVSKVCVLFKPKIMIARNKYKLKNYYESLQLFESAWGTLDKESLSFLNIATLKEFVSLCSRFNYENGIVNLKDVLFSEELFSMKHIKSFMRTIETEFPIIYEACCEEILKR